MKPITVYTMDYCPYCERAKSLLKSRNLAFQEIKVDVNDEAEWDRLEKRSKMRTMPQIFIGEQCVGGFTDLDALDRAGKLLPLINN